MEKLKKVLEHIIYFSLTAGLTYAISFIPFIRDTHKFVKSDLKIYRNYYRINDAQEITFDIDNKGSLFLDDRNTIIEYKSNKVPYNALIFDENGNTDTINITSKSPEPFRLQYPNWLKSRDNISIRIYYQNQFEIDDELRLRYVKDGKYSTIVSSKRNPYLKNQFKAKLNYLVWIVIIMIFILIIISIYWIRGLIPKLTDLYYKQLEKRFISNDKQFLKDDN
jgi:hypothetical protein